MSLKSKFSKILSVCISLGVGATVVYYSQISADSKKPMKHMKTKVKKQKKGAKKTVTKPIFFETSKSAVIMPLEKTTPTKLTPKNKNIKSNKKIKKDKKPVYFDTSKSMMIKPLKNIKKQKK